MAVAAAVIVVAVVEVAVVVENSVVVFMFGVVALHMQQMIPTLF